MHELHGLIYTSRLAIDAPVSCISDIVRVSRVNNRRLAITGLLIFDGENFCQYLEGGQSELQALIETIKQDTRHTDFVMKYQGVVTGSRRFASWSIAYANVDEQALGDMFLATASQQVLATLDKILPGLDLQPA